MQMVTSLSAERKQLPLAGQWEGEEAAIGRGKKKVDGILIIF